MIAVLTYPRFRQQNNEVMSMKSAAMTLANLLANQALLASNISSLITNPLNIESYRQIVKCKSVFCYLEMKQPFQYRLITSLKLPVPKKLKNMISEIPVIPQTLNINN